MANAFELIQTRPVVEVLEGEYRRLLGYPRGRELDGRARELADMAREWYRTNGRPWIYARETAGLELRQDKVCAGAVEFSSRRLHDLFAEAEARRAVLVAVSAGKECEEEAQTLWLEGKPDEFYFLKTFGSAVVEHLVTLASGHICGWADAEKLVALPNLSPGHSGWDVADQPRLWELLRNEAGDRLPGALEVLDSGMLRPQSSLLTVFGLAANLERAREVGRLKPCQLCFLANCRFRRARYVREPNP
jgi:hypothetical protein